MPNSNQRAGSNWEVEAAEYLRDQGLKTIERIRIKHPDRGDLGGMTDWTIECKAISKLTLAEGMDQLGRAKMVNGTPWGVLLVKRRRCAAGRAFAVVELAQWAATARMLDEVAP